MASSKSSLNNSIPTCVLLLLLFNGCFRSSSSAALRTHTTERWQDPCGVGGEIATPIANMMTGEATGDFATLSNRSIAFKGIVSALKNDYITARFGDASLADEERDNAEFNITGIPSWTGSSGNKNETLLVCYENLARLAVLTRLTREAEETADGNRDFAASFQNIEGDNESGLYIIMCHLYVIMTDLGIQVLSPETIAEVSSIRLPEVSSNAIRHVRDYMVLLVLEDSADKLHSSFERLAGTETTP